MNHIPLIYIGAKISPWFDRLQAIAVQSDCFTLHSTDDIESASSTIAALATNTAPLLAIDQNNYQASLSSCEANSIQWSYVILGRDHNMVPGTQDEILDLSQDDTCLRASLLQRWVKDHACPAKVETNRTPDSLELAKKLIAATVHDLRTPLATVIGYCSFGFECMSDKEANLGGILERIQRSAYAMSELINRNLVSFELDHGQLKIHRTAIDLKSVLSTDLEIYKELAHNKGLEFICDCSESVPSNLLLDRFLLMQLVGNLIDNAIKFTDAGFIRITAFYELASQQLQIEIKDTGQGIHPDYQAMIFKPFAQENRQTDATLGHRGIGLGLDNARRLARSMGGDVFLKESELHKGTTFGVRVRGAIASSSEAPDFNPAEDILGNGTAEGPTGSQEDFQ